MPKDIDTIPGRTYTVNVLQGPVTVYAVREDGTEELVATWSTAGLHEIRALTACLRCTGGSIGLWREHAPNFNAAAPTAPGSGITTDQLNTALKAAVGSTTATGDNVSIPGGLAVADTIDAASGVRLGAAPATDADAASAGFAAALGVLMTAALHKPPFDALSLTGGWSSSVCVRGTQYASLKSTTEVSSALLSTINTAFLGGSISMHVASVLQLSTSGVKFTVVLGDISPLTQQTKQGLDGWRWVPTADSTVNTLTAHPIDIACVYKDGAYKPRVRQLVYEEGRWRVRTWWPDVTLTAASTQTLVFIPGNADGSLFMIGTHWGGGIVELQHVSIPSANNNSLNKVRAVYVDSPGSAAAGNVTGLAYIGSELVTREQLLAALRAKAAMGNTLTVTEEVEDYVVAETATE